MLVDGTMEPDQGIPVSSLNSPPASGCHRLPQLPSMGRNVRTAQSKTSAKLNFESKPRDEAAVLHIDGTSKVVKILTDGISEWTEFENKETVQIVPSANEKCIPDPKNSSEEATLSPLLKKKRQKKNTGSDIRLKKGVQVSPNIANAVESTNIPDSDNSNLLNNFETLEKKDICTNINCSDKDVEVTLPDKVHHDSQNISKISDKSILPQEDKSKKKKESPLEKKKRASKMGHENELKGTMQLVDNTTNIESKQEETKPALPEIKDAVSNKGHTPRCVLILSTEVPTGIQLEKLLSMNSAPYDSRYPPVWEEGDMLWAKVSGHPYWPCMVSQCPFTKMFTRIKGDVKVIRSYHVQFFGNEVERGWINEASLMLFEGKLSFLEKAQLELTKQTKKGKSAYNPFKINISRRHAWNIAVEEAEGAMSLSKSERRVQYTFDYVFMDDLKKEKQFKKKEQVEIMDECSISKSASSGMKRKRTSSEGKGQSPVASKSKKRKLEIKYPLPKPVPFGAEISFDTYYANHRSTVIEQHPEWDTTFVFEYLRQQWEKEKKKTARSPHSTTVDTSTPQGNVKKGRGSKLMKLLSGESPVGSDSYQEVKEQGSPGLTKRRGRPPKYLQQMEVELVKSSSPASVTQEPEESLMVDEDTARPKLAASALSARKVSQESDSSTESKGKGLRENEPYELEIFKLNSTCKIDKDKICAICEKNGDVFECTKSCGQHFHPSCGNFEPHAVEQFVCLECSSGIHTCFSCKKADMETIKCSVNMCGKYYHEDCIRKYRLTRWELKGFICPLHTCATCAVDNVKNPKAIKGRFYRCVRCPTAYHVGDFCVAAGSINLAGTYIVCSDHFQPNRSLSCHSRLNITWCFSCSKGGTLLCCETCPAAFHAECVKVEKTPEEAWFCMDCAAGRKPLYGNIVWIKVGNYRWWPGEICHPRHVPLNIQEKAHQVGEFPVRFFGSHDYYWIHRGRVFLFQDGDKGSKEGSSRGLFKIYMKGVKEATEAFKLWTAAKAKKVEQEQERNDKKPAPYKFIKSNVPIGNVQIHKAELSEIPRCECKPDQTDPCTSDCLNRMMMYECHPAVCPAGEKCNNQRFQKRQYPELEPFKSETRGWGLRCLEDIKKGQFVQEYVGDVIDEEECKRRIEQAHEDNITNFYMLTMDKNRIIDAGPKGNYSRFMNHSCCPNLETQKWTVNGDIRVGLFALCNILKGSELTFNYNLECLGNEKKACACGSNNCSGFLGVRPKTAAAAANEKKSKEPKKKRRKKKLDPRKEHEDDCFRCGEGGELVMCDKGNCPKVYHLQCLKLTKPPSGKWQCPWHHCDECGKLAVSKCTECPNSYCAAHIQGNIYKVEGLDICSDHTELLENSSQPLESASVIGRNGTKSEADSNSSESEGLELPNTGIEKSKNENNFENSLDPACTEKTVDCNLDLKSEFNTKDKIYKVDDKNTKITQELNTETNKLLLNTKPVGLVSNLTPGPSPFRSTAPVSDISKQPTRVNVTRTKARYRARLTQTKVSKSKNPSVSNIASENPQSALANNESDDNDSISDLVIDIP